MLGPVDAELKLNNVSAFKNLVVYSQRFRWKEMTRVQCDACILEPRKGTSWVKDKDASPQMTTNCLEKQPWCARLKKPDARGNSELELKEGSKEVLEQAGNICGGRV